MPLAQGTLDEAQRWIGRKYHGTSREVLSSLDKEH
jgi:hypothetical protein